MSRRGRRSGRMTLALLALAVGLVPAAAGTADGDARVFDALARAIVRHAGDARPVRIGLGRFERGREGVEDPLALEIRHELAQALGALDGVELVAHAEVGARQLDSPGAAGSQPGLPPAGAGTLADYLVQGTMLDHEDGYRLLVDVVEPATGRVFKEAAWVEGSAALAAIDRPIADRAAGRRTVREVEAFLKSMRQDFRLGLMVGGDGRRSFQVGERIDYYLRSERDAHVAVISHQHDGASFPLLPNLLADDNFFAAGEVAPINRGRYDVFATTPGVDVIQAIACERRAPIDRIIESFGGRFDGEAETPFLPAIERGALFATWRQILVEQTDDRCASMAIGIEVSDRPPAPSPVPTPTTGGRLTGEWWLLVAALCTILRWLSH